jgi:hypothetical protein
VNIGLMKLAACQLLFWYDRNSVWKELASIWEYY